jgi:hypothetical protein
MTDHTWTAATWKMKMNKLSIITALSVALMGTAQAEPFKMICEHPGSHQQVQVAIDADKVHYTDQFGESEDFPTGDVLVVNDRVVNMHFGPKCVKGYVCNYFINFYNPSYGYAATLKIGQRVDVTVATLTFSTAYCIVPGRIVQ